MTRSFVFATRWQLRALPLPPARLMAVLAATIVLHWVLLSWSGIRIGTTLPTWRNADPITVALHQPPMPQPVAAPAVAIQKAKPVKKPKKPLEPKPESALPAAEPMTSPLAMTADGASETIAVPIMPPLTDAVPDTPTDERPVRLEAPSQPETVIGAPLAEEPVSLVQAAEQPVFPRSYRIAAPPPADLEYDVQALRDGQNVYGSGRIVWQPAGNAYRIQGEAGVLFFNVLEFQSEGALDDSGIAPVVYSEKRFRKPMTRTHFQREEGVIRFSTSTLTYPHQGGEQDRASIVWQLAGIGRGDPEAFRPNADLTVFVAGARNGETWHVRVVGEEQIQVDAGSMRTWHAVREPRAGSYDQKLDIWFAPEQEWYPVRLRYTEQNGDWLEMSLSAIRDIASR